MGGSSSNRRQHRERQGRGAFRPRANSNYAAESVASGSLSADGVVSLSFEQHAITSGRGFDLLCRMGHVEGQPLGQPNPLAEQSQNAVGEVRCVEQSRRASVGDRRTQPISIIVRPSRVGLGASPTTRAETPAERAAKATHSLPVEFERMRPGKGQRIGQDIDPLSVATLAESVEVLSLTRDPLRPRCSFNPDHVVADLKAKQRHECRCPDRPNRENNQQRTPNQFATDSLRASPADIASSNDSSSTADDIMSDLSQDDDTD